MIFLDDQQVSCYCLQKPRLAKKGDSLITNAMKDSPNCKFLFRKIMDSLDHSKPNLDHFKPNLDHFKPNLDHFKPNLDHFKPNLDHFKPNLTTKWFNSRLPSLFLLLYMQTH